MTGVVYNNSNGTQPVGALTQVNYGSGDFDNFSYDPQTGRMTGYQFNVGASGQAVIGALTWNQNGTLQQLKITDPFNSADQQTCTYSYDDVARISGANCGSIWAQDFSYDLFGNLTASGSSSWMPGYNSASNHYTLAGTSYDADGNLLTDTFNTYSWNAEGKLISANGVGVTNDELGRMVELGNTSGPVQFLYAPGGQQPVAETKGQNLVNAYVPLPGGGFAIYGSSGLAQYNHADWLGSARVISTPGRTVSTDMAMHPMARAMRAVVGCSSPVRGMSGRCQTRKDAAWMIFCIAGIARYRVAGFRPTRQGWRRWTRPTRKAGTDTPT